ncbi:MAG: exo-alpha-sialidase [Bryobacteraceae bacterium]|jgi:hypothetical protein
MKSIFLLLSIAAAALAADLRNIDTGLVIVRDAYADQPYVVVLDDGRWLCTVTLGPLGEGQGKGNRTMATVSADKGKTWSPPVKANDVTCGVPVKTRFGRVYAITGGYFAWSDDAGRTWSEKRVIPARLSAWPDGKRDPETSVWAVGMPWVAGGSVFVPWAKRIRGQAIPIREVCLFKSDNILVERDPDKVRWRMLPDRDTGIKPPPDGTVAEEPHVVSLSDGTLYTVFRTNRGYIGHATSKDGGETWSDATYVTYASGRRLRHPRACPSLWKASNGKYLLWFHNHGGNDYRERNPAWISGGVERGGEIQWSEPEILLYTDDLSYETGRLSYPGFFEDGGRHYITETQKTIARLHEIDGSLLDVFNAVWTQGQRSEWAAKGLVLSLDAPAKEVEAPALPNLKAGGFTLDLWLQLNDVAPGQVILDSRDATGKGVLLVTGGTGNVRLEMNDGKNGAYWDSDAGTLRAGKRHHACIIVDGGPNIISFVIDGVLNDGGAERRYGWGRFPAGMEDINGEKKWKVAPSLRGRLMALRAYDRYLLTSEAVGNFRAGL